MSTSCDYGEIANNARVPLTRCGNSDKVRVLQTCHCDVSITDETCIFNVWKVSCNKGIVTREGINNTKSEGINITPRQGQLSW